MITSRQDPFLPQGRDQPAVGFKLVYCDALASKNNRPLGRGFIILREAAVVYEAWVYFGQALGTRISCS